MHCYNPGGYGSYIVTLHVLPSRRWEVIRSPQSLEPVRGGSTVTLRELHCYIASVAIFML